MIIFPVQLDSFRITKIGDRVLTLHTYEEFAEEVSKLTNKSMGTEYMVLIMETSSKEYEDFKQETPDDTRERIWRQFHAEITDTAKLTGEKPDELKQSIKETLVREGKIKESTKELTVEQLAEEIIRLKNYKATLQHGKQDK